MTQKISKTQELLRQLKPSAKIANSRNNILKLYGNKVYLNSGDEFKLELYNPKTKPVLAKIYLNGTLISETGILLRPGERVWLDRYIDIAKKFLFETYEVGLSESDKAAIADNGKVKVEFYDEYVTHPYYYGTTITSTNLGNTVIANRNLYNINYTNNASDIIGSNTCYNLTDLNISAEHIKSSTSVLSNSAKQETGRISEGDVSQQSFKTVRGNFNSWVSTTVEYQILPLSQKQEVYASEIRSYCTTCGARKKKTQWKHCPDCGTKF